MDSAYELALFEIGKDGKFQKEFDVMYNFILMTFWSVAYMNTLLPLVMTPHHCQLPPKPENLSDRKWQLLHIPIESPGSEYDKLSSCLLYDTANNDSQNCDAYEYDTSWYKSTIPMEYGWVCDKEIYIAQVFSYSRLGEIVGSLLFGWIGDAFGRQVMYKTSMLLIITGRFLSICAGNNFLLFTFGCMVSSFPSWSVPQSVSDISMEISSPERRTIAAIFRSAAWTLGLSFMPFLYWWLQNWKLFMILTTAPVAVFLMLSWNIIESPRWLLLEGKNDKCIIVLKHIAKTNGTILGTGSERELKSITIEAKLRSLGPLELFSSWTLALTTVMQLLCWVCICTCYQILLLSSGGKTDGNPFIEFAWQTAAEMPGNFLGAWLSDRIGRRYGGSMSFGVLATLFTFMTLRTHGDLPWIQKWWIGSILLIMCRLFVNVAYYVIGIFNMELYPTCLRQSGLSMSNVSASTAGALAPYILYLGHRVNATLPHIVLVGCSLLGVLFVLMLPETLNVPLPVTLEDARTFGKQKRKNKSRLKNIDLIEEETDFLS